MNDTHSKPFSAAGTARDLVANSGTASLATLDPESGWPFASFVTVAAGEDLSPVLLLSTLALHTRNLAADPRASLLFVDDGATIADADPLVRTRLMAIGTVSVDDRPETRALFLERNPEAAVYADFTDFSFYRLNVEKAHLVAGFGRIVELSAADLSRGDR